MQADIAGRIRTYILPLAVITYASLAFALFPATFLEMARSYFSQAVILPVIILIGLPLVSIALRPKAPASLIFDVLRGGTVRLALVLFVFCLGMAAFTTFKLAIPKFVPFYADPFLAQADSWLHGGDPGLFAHALVPGWAQYPLGYLYGPIWFLLWFGLLALVTLNRNAVLRKRYYWAMSLTVCLLGTVAATLFSSVGPIFYDRFIEGQRFADLMVAIRQSAIGDYMNQASGYLLTSYESGQTAMGTGISAMPSMHLAIVTLNACMLTGINRYLGLLAWLYVAAILLGSVYLGWHYALDGYASIAAVSLIWWVCGRVFTSTRDKAATDDPVRPIPAR